MRKVVAITRDNGVSSPESPLPLVVQVMQRNTRMHRVSRLALSNGTRRDRRPNAFYPSEDQ